MSKKLLLIAFLSVFLAGTAYAEFNVNINIGTPPPVVVAAPPVMAVIPGSYVYVATNVGNANLVFYHDNWYRSHNGGWFVSVNFNGPWKQVSAPPDALVRLPQNYHQVPQDRERLPYDQVRSNWRAWERDRHWDRVAERHDDERERREGHHKKHKKKKHHDDEDDDHDGGRDRHEHGHGHGHD